jgi:hypothetical protein
MHAASLALYTSLLAMRTATPALQASADVAGEAWAAGDAALVVRRSDGDSVFLIVAQLRGAGDVNYGKYLPDARGARVVLSSEDPRFAPDPDPPEIVPARVGFKRPGAVILQLA